MRDGLSILEETLLNAIGAGRFAEAEAIADRLLLKNADHVEALSAASICRCARGDFKAGIPFLQRAIQLAPDRGDLWINLGVALDDAKAWAEAAQAAERAIKLTPGSARATVVLANSRFHLGRPDLAIPDYLRATLFEPDFAPAWANLVEAYKAVGDRIAVWAAAKRWVALDPSNPEAVVAEASARAAHGDLSGAEGRLRTLLALRGDYIGAWFALGITLSDQRRFEEAATAFERALMLDPGNPHNMQALAVMRKYVGRLSEARDLLFRALAIKPDFPLARLSLTGVMMDMGEIQESITLQREILKADPGDLSMRSNFVMALNYAPDLSPSVIGAEHAAWNDAWTRATARTQRSAGSFRNNPDPNRPVRVGYVSPDFRTHSVAYFARPLFAAHDRRAVEVTGYCDVVPDRQTQAIAAVCDRWRDVSNFSDHDLATMIEADQIDILVDLCGHTFNNRMSLFAGRAAPVQVSWLGYPNTTGLAAIDYRIVDAVTDPQGDPNYEAAHAETLIRLNRVFLSYEPPEGVPEPNGTSPIAENGFPVFGGFHTQAKLTDPLFDAWGQIMAAVPEARLILKNVALTDPMVRRRTLDRLAARGIAESRIGFHTFAPTTAAAFDCWNLVDIALDAFPYNGTTTICEALWMATPVVTLRGQTHAGRVGASLLDAVGAPELIADDLQGYVGVAVALARDPERLGRYARDLRPMMASSPLTDAGGFARNLESAYRDMWLGWSRSQAGTTP